MGRSTQKSIRYWQLASGDETRDYSKVFLDFGVACLGPGNAGPINDKSIKIYADYEGEDEWGKIKPITQVQAGDRIILKKGQRRMQAVGEAIEWNGSVYNFSDCFNDLDGWDLQHFVKVKWKIIKKIYGRNELVRATMQRVRNQTVIRDIELVWDEHNFIRDTYIIQEPQPSDLVDYDGIEQSLVDLGYPILNAENIARTIQRIGKLAKWYQKNYKQLKMSEHEIRTFLVVPFLEALGWAAQHIGIEVQLSRKKMDIVLYHDAERERPFILIETKNMFTGSALAVSQSIRYLKELTELDNVKYFMVTDGLKYWLYARLNGDWTPIAYINFENLQRKYSAYPECCGVLGFLRLLMDHKQER